MPGQRSERGGQYRLKLPHPAHKLLALDDVQVGQADRAGSRVRRVGISVPEDLGRPGAPERLGHLRSSQYRAKGQVAGGQALGHNHHVRLEAVPVAAKPLAGAAKSGDDLVCHEEHIVLPADLLNLLQVAVRREVHAARADNRLAEERADPVGAGLLDQLGQCSRVIPGHVIHERDQRAEGVSVRRNAA